MLKLLSDPNRVRLLVLLEREELTVAELANITRLAQPRVSTQLAKLRQLSFVIDRKSGVQVYYRFNEGGLKAAQLNLWSVIKDTTDDGLLQDDRDQLEQVLAARALGNSWVDRAAGDMERHYSPGRTWEATARAMLKLVHLGDVLDIASGDGVLAELIAAQSGSVTCVDINDRVVAAGHKRLSSLSNVSFEKADMHQLPFQANCFDQVLMMHALSYSNQAELVLSEIARVLKPDGQLLAAILKSHTHKVCEAFDHVNQGYQIEELIMLCENAGLAATFCEVTSMESRPPHYQVITLLASLR